MKKVWKWILGIILVLVVVAALVAVPFVMRNYMAANFNRATVQTAPGTNQQAPGYNGGPMMRNFGPRGRFPGGFDDRTGRMMGGGRNFERGFSRFGGFAPFGFGLMFLGGFLRLIPLVLLGLLLWGAYTLGKRSGMRSMQAPAPVATQPAPPAAASEEKSAE
jgi:hypothetical protein